MYVAIVCINYNYNNIYQLFMLMKDQVFGETS